MALELVIENSCGFTAALSEEDIYALLVQVLDAEGLAVDCSVSLSLVDDVQMRRLNKEWREIDAATDVLSFECERPGDADVVAGVPVELGDIVLAPTYLERQAASFKTSPADEWRLMLVHAMLHLLGYDHETPVDAARMQKQEEAILSSVATDGTLSKHTLALHREEDS